MDHFDGQHGRRKWRQTIAELQTLARDMRRELTPEELMLWNRLRARRLAGLKFRCQHPVGNFILDFYCPMCRLVVEVDGGIHKRTRERDAERTAILESYGYDIVRFTNEQVIGDIDGVLASILRTAHELYASEHGTAEWPLPTRIQNAFTEDEM